MPLLASSTPKSAADNRDIVQALVLVARRKDFDALEDTDHHSKKREPIEEEGTDRRRGNR
jgi:hypothetical protein